MYNKTEFLKTVKKKRPVICALTPLPRWLLSVSFMNLVPMTVIKPAVSEPEIFTHMDPGIAPQKHLWENHGNSCHVLRRNKELFRQTERRDYKGKKQKCRYWSSFISARFHHWKPTNHMSMLRLGTHWSLHTFENKIRAQKREAHWNQN